MGTKNNPGAYDCYKYAYPDEPMFILLARDFTAPAVIKYWCEVRLKRLKLIQHALTPEQIEEEENKIEDAVACIGSMNAWFGRNRLSNLVLPEIGSEWKFGISNIVVTKIIPDPEECTYYIFFEYISKKPTVKSDRTSGSYFTYATFLDKCTLIEKKQKPSSNYDEDEDDDDLLD